MTWRRGDLANGVLDHATRPIGGFMDGGGHGNASDCAATPKDASTQQIGLQVIYRLGR